MRRIGLIGHLKLVSICHKHELDIFSMLMIHRHDYDVDWKNFPPGKKEKHDLLKRLEKDKGKFNEGYYSCVKRMITKGVYRQCRVDDYEEKVAPGLKKGLFECLFGSEE